MTTPNFSADYWYVTPLYDDPLTDGWFAISDYVERFWLPILGPTSTLILRHCYGPLSDTGNYALDLELAPQMFGIGPGRSRHSIWARSIMRLVQFGMARCKSAEELEMRTIIPGLSSGQVVKLHPELAAQHRTFIETYQETHP